MKKNVKRFLIASLSLLSVALIGAACGEKKPTGGNGNSSVNVGNDPIFNAEYEADYGEVYYFETAIANGKPLEYTVTQNGEAVEVKNYGFMASKAEDYDVSVKYRGENRVIGSFTVKVTDSGAPNIAFSYQQKFVLAGTDVQLPEISLSDNQDTTVSYTTTLTKDNEKVDYSGNTFQAVDGEYAYTVKATDSAGNVSEKTCLITAGGVLDVARGVNWTNPNTDVEYCREISGGETSVSDEITYGGFDTSFKVTLNTSTATTCVTVKNALIDDISGYDYFLVYMPSPTRRACSNSCPLSQ